MRVPRSLTTGAAAVALAVAAFAVSGTASAKEEPSAIDRVAAALDKAGEKPAEAGPTVSTESGKVNVDPNAPSVSITAGQSTVRMTLQGAPKTSSASAGEVRAYGDAAAGTDAAVRTLNSESAQILAVLRDGSAPKAQRYHLELPKGTQLHPLNGGFLLVGEDGAVSGTIAAPWAKDATGRNLPTSYSVEGSTLVQHVDTTGARYPVVADPKLTYGLGVYLNMWGAEARAIAIEAVAIGGTGVAVACTVVSKLPHPVLVTIATLACGAGAVNLKKVFDAIVTIWRSNGLNDGDCYQMKIIPNTVDKLTRVDKSNCR